MVTVLQLNRMELKDMIINEIAENPVLEEAAEAGEELTPAEVQSMLERERQSDPADQSILDKVEGQEALGSYEGGPEIEITGDIAPVDGQEIIAVASTIADEAPKSETDPFEEIDFGSFFDDYLDPGFKSPASESVEKPSFETFLSSPITLSDHLHSQLSVMVLPERVRRAANTIIGNLEESGYLTTPVEEIAVAENLSLENVKAGLKAVQSLDPSGVGASNLRECLLLQLDARGCRDGVAWQIIHDHLKLLEKPAVGATRTGHGTSARAHSDCGWRDPASGSRTGSKILRSRSAAGGAGCLHF